MQYYAGQTSITNLKIGDSFLIPSLDSSDEYDSKLVRAILSHARTLNAFVDAVTDDKLVTHLTIVVMPGCACAAPGNEVEPNHISEDDFISFPKMTDFL